MIAQIYLNRYSQGTAGRTDKTARSFRFLAGVLPLGRNFQDN